MKKVFLSSLIIAFTPMTFAKSLVVESITALGIREFYCDVESKKDLSESSKSVTVLSIFASNETEAIKDCLNSVQAKSFMVNGNMVMKSRDNRISDQEAYITNISVRTGMMSE